MSIINFLKMKDKFEIQPWGEKQHFDRENHIPFSGSLRKHPHETDRIILIADPFTDNTFYYEFKAADIAFAEDLPSITNVKGESISMVCIWVKKQSIAIRSIPFVVDTLSRD